MSNSDEQRRRPGPWPPVEAPSTSAPTASWAKRTGFKPKFSGESASGESVPSTIKPKGLEIRHDIELGENRPSAPNGMLPEADRAPALPADTKDPSLRKRKERDGIPRSTVAQNERSRPVPVPPPVPKHSRSDDSGAIPPSHEDNGLLMARSHMKYELRDAPGLVPIGLYGVQHYLSLMGSLILIPLVIVPAMGGTHDDTAAVVSTVLFVSGVTTLLHTFFGSRLPLVQGPSYVYLAPVLAIINSEEFLELNNNNFKHVMKVLQGAILISSAFQAIMGYSGLMALILRLINPVVVAPTIAAVGLSFFTYGFPRVGSCLEIGLVQIMIVILFSLYLRKISIFGHRIFLIYAVPLGLGITWAIAFLLTEAGAYNYRGCDVNVPVSNIQNQSCRSHVLKMKHCRVDTFHVLNSSPWFRFPYPLQWGTPIFTWKMAIVMCAVSIIASVDSIGSYHASSLLVASRPPTPGVVSRGIGLEGICSIMASLWGTGSVSTTLTENVHTIAVTKMGSRRAVEIGACILIVLSLIGKVGAFLASIPDVMVAALLCCMWAILTALGLSNLRYSEAGSSRNIIIVGLALFFSLSVPAYFQQYGISPSTNLPVPSYFLPYIVASHGPFKGKYHGLNYVMNTLLSLHVVVAFLLAAILDNTVPGSRQERGVYVWSDTESVRREPTVVKDYELPFQISRMFRWVKWVGI